MCLKCIILSADLLDFEVDLSARRCIIAVRRTILALQLTFIDLIRNYRVRERIDALVFERSECFNKRLGTQGSCRQGLLNVVIPFLI